MYVKLNSPTVVVKCLILDIDLNLKFHARMAHSIWHDHDRSTYAYYNGCRVVLKLRGRVSGSEEFLFTKSGTLDLSKYN